MSIKVPCKDCKDRSTTCHGVCERYKEYRSKIDGLAESRRKRIDTLSVNQDSYVRVMKNRKWR